MGWKETFADGKAKFNKFQADRQATKEEYVETYGAVVVKQNFGGKQIEIRDRGYVRIADGWVDLKTPFEKLISIRANIHTRDKSPAGRSLASGMTLGLSKFTSNEHERVNLSVVTDQRTLPLKDGTAESALALEAAAEGVLAALRAAGAVAPAPAAGASSVAGQIKELAELHAAGALSDDEFAAAKAQLLGGPAS